MNITDAIFELPHIVSPSFCKHAINFINFEKLKDMGVGAENKGTVIKDIRNVQGISAFPFGYNYKNPDLMKQQISLLMFFHRVRKQLKIPVLNYHTKFQYITMDYKLLQADFLKYSEGGHYDVHVDAGVGFTRKLTAIINLNDDYEGGEFCFYNPIGRRDKQKEIYKTKLGKGSVLMFPSDFLYPHTVKPITKGKRYSIVCWMG